jgi:hypothetical protein
MKNLYLALTIVGTVLPLSQFYGFLTEYGLDVQAFVAQLFANKVSAFFAMDFLVTFVVTIVFMEYQRRKQPVKNYWVCYPALFFVGISCGLPLFLYLQENQNPAQVR